MPVEQPRRKQPLSVREPTVPNRRTNALKHQHGGGGTHPGATHPSVLKDSFSSVKNSGHVNGVNVIGLTQSSVSPSNQPMSTSMSSKLANMTGSNATNTTHTLNQTGSFSLKYIYIYS